MTTSHEYININMNMKHEKKDKKTQHKNKLHTRIQSQTITKKWLYTHKYTDKPSQKYEKKIYQLKKLQVAEHKN